MPNRFNILGRRATQQRSCSRSTASFGHNRGSVRFCAPPDGNPRQLDVMAFLQTTKRVMDFTDIWEFVRADENDEHLRRPRYAEYGNEVTILKLHDFVFELTYCWFTITGEIGDSTSLRHFFASDSLLPQFLICLFCRSWIALSRAGVKSWLTCCLVSESKRRLGLHPNKHER